MYSAVLLSAALLTGQVEAPPHTVHILPPIGVSGDALPVSASTDIRLVSGGSCSSGACGKSCDSGSCKSSCAPCTVQWFVPWTCKDLERTPAEPAKKNCCGGFLYNLLYCPEEPEEAKDGNGDAKNGDAKNGDAKNGEAANGEASKGKAPRNRSNSGDPQVEEDKVEEPPAGPTPLMQFIKCRAPDIFERMACNGVSITGFIQGGYTANPASPSDRLNYGVNFNNRSNDFLLNQVYFILERPLDLETKKDQWHMGFRIDAMYGHDAPYFENAGLGLVPSFLGDRAEASRLTEMGIGFWNFYADLHAPILTKRGVDFRAGRFISLMGHEASPGKDTTFYSRPYEFFYGVPFTNIGGLATVHLGDTVDIINGLVRGYEVVFQDTNDSWSYTGAYIWNSCDSRKNFTLSWITGPEQVQNNHNNRTLFTAFGSRRFGCYDEWKVLLAGSVGFEQNAAVNPNTGATSAGEWYGFNGTVLYTVDPRLTLGLRAEWWRDDDGIRTGFANSDHGGATWNRPGYAGNFYDVTVGATYRIFQNLRVRPEVRFDWFDGIAADGSNSRPYNDQRDTFQTTIGADVIWEF